MAKRSDMQRATEAHGDRMASTGLIGGTFTPSTDPSRFSHRTDLFDALYAEKQAAVEALPSTKISITLPNGDYLLVNEDGKLKNLPLNPEATALWKATFDNDQYITGRNDFVVGPAILIKKAALKRWAA